MSKVVTQQNTKTTLLVTGYKGSLRLLFFLVPGEKREIVERITSAHSIDR